MDTRGRPGRRRPPQRHAGGGSGARVRGHDGANLLPLFRADGHRRAVAAVPRHAGVHGRRRCLQPGPVHRDHGARRPRHAGAEGSLPCDLRVGRDHRVGADRRLFDPAPRGEHRGKVDPARDRLRLDDDPDHVGLVHADRARRPRVAPAVVANDRRRERLGRRVRPALRGAAALPLRAPQDALLAPRRHVLRADRDRNGRGLRARCGWHRVRSRAGLRRHGGGGHERAARLRRVHLPGASFLHPGRVHHGPRRRRRAHRRFRGLAHRPRSWGAFASDDRRRLHLVVHLGLEGRGHGDGGTADEPQARGARLCAGRAGGLAGRLRGNGGIGASEHCADSASARPRRSPPARCSSPACCRRR